ncbi:MAG: agmatine deiminase family protein, partial [Verrucomicrobiales bacterium]
AGTALVARQALLDPRRNPGLTEAQAEVVLLEQLGIERVIWLDEQVPGDDTDGHVDVYARFVSEDQIIACHDNGAVTRIRSALPGFEILPLDPPPALEIEGQRVPAGYANFYIANRCVLLPVFGARQDDAAAALLRQCFPGRDIIPIDCRELAWGLGSIHCLTQQLPTL